MRDTIQSQALVSTSVTLRVGPDWSIWGKSWLISNSLSYKINTRQGGSNILLAVNSSVWFRFQLFYCPAGCEESRFREEKCCLVGTVWGSVRILIVRGRADGAMLHRVESKREGGKQCPLPKGHAASWRVGVQLIRWQMKRCSWGETEVPRNMIITLAEVWEGFSEEEAFLELLGPRESSNILSTLTYIL